MLSKTVCVVTSILLLGWASTASAVFDPSQDMIIHYDFEGDALNKATGPSSAGAAGDGQMLNFDGGDFVPGQIGQALDFDGIDDYVEVDDAVLPNFRNRTITVWAQRETVGGVTAPGSGRKIISARGGNYRMNINNWDSTTLGQPTDYIGFDVASAGGAVELPYAPGVNQWIHYAIVLEDDGALANATYYVNGQVFGQELGVSQHNQTSLEGFLIGRQSFASNLQSWWGQIDDFRIYDRVLTQGEVEAVMNIPEPTTALLVVLGLSALGRRRRR